VSPSGLWWGRTVRIVSALLVIAALLLGGPWTLVAALAGAALAWSLADRPSPHSMPASQPLDVRDTLDWLRRACGARAAWLIGLPDGDVDAVDPGDAAPSHELRERGAALARLASVDGRVHVAADGPGGTFVAVGDFPYGAGLLLAATGDEPAHGQAATAELRRLLAGVRLAERAEPEAHGQVVSRRLALGAAGVQTLEGIARLGATLAEQLTHCPTAIVVQNRIAGVSPAADRRLTDRQLAPESPVARAVQSGLPVVTNGNDDIFGAGMPERRRRDRAGMAVPLVDGHQVVGALVVIGAGGGAVVTEPVTRLIAELGPRLAAARAVHEAEQRAVRDPLTGLPNRREFERVLAAYREHAEQATLVYADLDRFKLLNDSLGHAAGDAALKHIADVLRAQIRDGDMAARIGGEEFAIWLPATPLGEGLEVAQRMRLAVESAVWRWSGTPYPLTMSCGVANYPVTVADVNNLRVAADAALYKAKQAGRNRVEKAGPGD
jgi:diguanylate cyclase (GGDEF)-like protein